jgi:hypothetical protein
MNRMNSVEFGHSMIEFAFEFVDRKFLQKCKN